MKRENTDASLDLVFPERTNEHQRFAEFAKIEENKSNLKKTEENSRSSGQH